MTLFTGGNADTPLGERNNDALISFIPGGKKAIGDSIYAGKPTKVATTCPGHSLAVIFLQSKSLSRISSCQIDGVNILELLLPSLLDISHVVHRISCSDHSISYGKQKFFSFCNISNILFSPSFLLFFRNQINLGQPLKSYAYRIF